MLYFELPGNVMSEETQKTILIVEDDEDFRTILKKILSKEGFKILTASNGAEGLASYEEAEPDLVILDVHLPDALGTEICRKIRDEGPRPNTPVLLCTVRSGIVSVAEGLNAGASDYILKPFSPDDLLARVKKAFT